MKNQYRLIKKNEKQEIKENNDEHIENEPQLYEIKENVEFKDAKPVAKKQNKYVYYYIYVYIYMIKKY